MRAGFIVLGVALLTGSTADARKVEDVFRGKVVITTKRAPARFSNAGAFVRFLQSNRKEQLWPEKKNKKEWRYEFMAFFARPHNDIEVTVKFYDVTEGKKFIAADSFYLAGRGQRILASSMVLNRPRFDVNRKYNMVVLNPKGGNALASATFWLRGEKERYSGKVTFSDADTKGKDKDDGDDED
ncbi:MAG: hypothetical protein ACOY3Y_10510 [Acidobacteriota bacterium]